LPITIVIQITQHFARVEHDGAIAGGRLTKFAQRREFLWSEVWFFV
jgi:hypothetical protein